MLISTMFNTDNPDIHFGPESLLMNLDKEIDFYLPSGVQTTGILRRVEVLTPTRVELYIEIDDRYRIHFIDQNNQYAIHN